MQGASEPQRTTAMLAGPAPGRAAFLATTGPGFFTRAVMRGLCGGEAAEVDDGSLLCLP